MVLNGIYVFAFCFQTVPEESTNVSKFSVIFGSNLPQNILAEGILKSECVDGNFFRVIVSDYIQNTRQEFAIGEKKNASGFIFNAIVIASLGLVPPD